MIGGLVELVTDPFGHPVFIEEVDRLADQIVEIDSPGQALRLAIGPRISSACGKRLCIKVSPEDARAQFKEIVAAFAQPRRKGFIIGLGIHQLGRAFARFALASPKDRKKVRSEEHTSELRSLMRNSYAVLCLKK